jgi:NUDIX domain
MSEIIVFFDKDQPENPIHVDRKDKSNPIYNGKFLHVIDVILFNSYGEILLQQRARHKTSAGLLHTSIWGHVNIWEKPAFTVIHECLEEIWVPAILTNQDQFQMYFNRLSANTDRCALLSHVRDYFDDIPFENPLSWTIYQAFDRRYLCYGIYDWPLLSVDRDAWWFIYMTLDEILTAIENKNPIFTPPLMHMITNNIDSLIEFRNLYCKKLS